MYLVVVSLLLCELIVVQINSIHLSVYFAPTSPLALGVGMSLVRIQHSIPMVMEVAGGTSLGLPYTTTDTLEPSTVPPFPIL